MSERKRTPPRTTRLSAVWETAEGLSQGAASTLSSTILDNEEARTQAAEAAWLDVVYEDAVLPGVGVEDMDLRDGLRRGGMITFGTLAAIEAFDELEGAALAEYSTSRFKKRNPFDDPPRRLLRARRWLSDIVWRSGQG